MVGVYVDVVKLFGQVLVLVLQYLGIVLWLGYVLEDVDDVEGVVVVYCCVYVLMLGEFYIVVQCLVWQCCLCDWQDVDMLVVQVCNVFVVGQGVVEFFVFFSEDVSVVEQLVCVCVCVVVVVLVVCFFFVVKVCEYGLLCVGFFFNGFGVYFIGLLIVVLFEYLCYDWVLQLYLFVLNYVDGSCICECLQVVIWLYEVVVLWYVDIVVCICVQGIDLLFDLCGWGGGGMFEVLVMCLVLLQLNWLVYFGILGVCWLDVVVVDEFVLLVLLEFYFSECVLCLLCVFQFLDNICVLELVLFCVECSLFECGVVFCCFNNSYKFNLCSMGCVFVVLQVVFGSVLWLLFGFGKVDVCLCVVVQVVGLDLMWLVFMVKLLYLQYLVCYQLVDLFLDMYLYNVYIIVFDVFWVGCLVLICLGDIFVVCVVGSFNYYLGFLWMNVVDDVVFIVIVSVLGNDLVVLVVLCVELVQVCEDSGVFDMVGFVYDFFVLLQMLVGEQGWQGVDIF